MTLRDTLKKAAELLKGLEPLAADPDRMARWIALRTPK